MPGIRIDELPIEFAPDADHMVAAIKDEVTTQFSIAQIIELARAVIVAQILGGAPAQLDTLDELAAALADDANFAATITAALALKAPLASPALTGNPTAPTQTAGNDTTRIATTAFVQAMRTALLSDTVTLSNKTFNALNSWDRGTLVLKQGTNPTPTAEGDIQWDTDDNRIKIGDGANTLTFGQVTDWAAFTPTFTSFGTVSAVSMFWRRLGDTLHIQGAWTTGTVPAGAEPRIAIDLGASLTVSSTKAPSGFSVAGNCIGALAGAFTLYPLKSPTLGFLNFGVQNSGNSAMNKITSANSNFADNARYSIQAEIPIQGW